MITPLAPLRLSPSLLTLLLAATPARPAAAAPQDACTTWRASLDLAGQDSNGISRKPSLAADGRWVAFESEASDLVTGDTNGFSDVFVRDLESGVTLLASRGIGAGNANGPSTHASISADGLFVVFESEASNLVGADTNGVRDVFLYDRTTSGLRRVSISTNSVQANGPSGAAGLWRGSAVSGDGRLVVFQSFADNLVNGDTNFVTDIFVHDWISGVTTRANMSAGPGPPIQANGSSQDPAISTDGVYVAYRSSANNLVVGDTNGSSDIFRTRLASLETVRVSSASDGTQADLDCGQPALSASGAVVAFESFASTLVPGDTNGQVDVFRHVVGTQTTERVSVGWDGAQSSGYAKSPSLSADGTRVGFTANGSQLVPGGNGIQSVYVRDVVAGSTERFGEDSAGSNGFAGCDDSSLSADGATMAFLSLADLDPLDMNSLHDIYLRQCGPTGSAYCAGTPVNCPCANGGDGTSGCANTAGPGATLSASGTPSVFADSVQLTASGLPATVPVLFFQGTTALNGLAFGDGLRCVGGQTRRLAVRFASGGVATYGIGADLPLSIRGSVQPSGQKLHYQAWYRDPMTFCTAAAFNLSSAVTIQWRP